jgi:hypothetical protein
MHRTLFSLFSLCSILTISACDPPDSKPDDDTGTPLVDLDGDGFDETVDCDDQDASIHPGAEELCDGVDNDCDSEVDEDVGTLWYPDADGDLWGIEEGARVSCDPIGGYSEQVGDCDDGDPEVNPDADERCNGVDDDCDELVDDEDDDAVDGETWFLDGDADGYGLDDETADACEQPSGYAEQGGDCDDGDPAFHPGAEESDCTDPNDYNCDGSTGYADVDGDGFAACEDCDDADDAQYPGAEELCNGEDDDCDAETDEDDATDVSTWYADSDGDGYGDPASSDIDCDQPSGFVADSSDCDDGDAAQFPGADELCNGEDDDCDGDTDEDDATDVQTWYADGDGDSYGDASVTDIDCDQPSGFVADGSDCDDTDAAQYPGADELCNGEDDDCDGDTDEDDATDVQTWYADSDGDSYGDASVTDIDCDQPSGFVADSGDCDDADLTVNPAATELCDGVDNDCDGDTDEDDAADVSTWYADSDGDGYGDAASTTAACSQPTGHLGDATDCDDGDAAVNPGATELCNGVDDDCDGSTDEGDAADASTWYADSDGDGYGEPSTAVDACAQPSGYLADDSDCDDGDAAINPAATEICDGADNDCDGSTDEDDATDASTWYADADGDGYGDAASTTTACVQPSGYSSDDRDCDDGDASVNPFASEACNGVDDDCDGDADDGVLGTDSACPAISCAEIIADDPSAGDGSYYLEGPTAGTFQAWCDMTADGGGWTLIGSVVNEVLVTGSHDRNWDSLAVWTDASTFGTIAGRQGADYKSEAFADIPGDDFLIHTDEYSFAFYNVVGDVEFSTFLADEYDASTCSTTFLASGADWSENLSAAQESMHSFVVHPWDNNASCFPNGNESAMIGFQLATCCWTPGVGNTPSGQATWDDYDLSLLRLAHLNPSTCSAGSYPCNDLGYENPNSNNCYDTSCKSTYAEMYVR